MIDLDIAHHSEMTERERASLWLKVKPHPSAWFDGFPCWEWLGTKMRGYGVVVIRGRQQPAHRVMYEHVVGMIPEVLVMDHLCRRPWCVNPAHLEPVTQKLNVRRGDSIAAMKFRQSHCKNGHEFDEKNTYVNAKGNRTCRACHRVAEMRRKEKKRTASAT